MDNSVMNIYNHNSGGDPHEQYVLKRNKYEDRYINTEDVGKYIKIGTITLGSADNYGGGKFGFSFFNYWGNIFINFDFDYITSKNTIDVYNIYSKGYTINDVKFIVTESVKYYRDVISIYVKIKYTGHINVLCEKNIGKKCNANVLDLNKQTLISSLPTPVKSLTINYEKPYLERTEFKNLMNGFSNGSYKLSLTKYKNGTINILGNVIFRDRTKKTIQYINSNYFPLNGETYSHVVIKVNGGQYYEGNIVISNSPNVIQLVNHNIPNEIDISTNEAIIFIDHTYLTE